MRTLTANQTAVYNLNHRKVDLRISIKNDAGTWVSLSTLEGWNWIESCRLGENIDQPVASASGAFIRNHHYFSLAPLMSLSKINASEVLVNAAREIKIETAVVPMDYETQETDWINVFEGRIDQLDWADHQMGFQCRDRSGLLQDLTIETEYVRGSDALNKDIENVIQDILDGAQTGITLACPVASSYAVKAYNQQRTQVYPALDALATLIAWQVRQKWDSGTSTWKTTLFEPDRWKAVADKTFYLDEYYKVSNITINLNGIRNIIEIPFTDATSGVRQTLQYPENGPAYEDTITGGVSTLNDSGKDWTVNAWVGYELWIVAGTGKGQHETISANTATQLTVDTSWSTQPDSTSFYAIVHADDSAESIIKYGRRFCGIAEEATKQVDSAARAFYMARRIYADISEPYAEQSVEMPYFHAVELGDLYTFVANGEHYDTDLTCAVVAYHHDFSQGKARTTLTVRGRPSGGYRKWFLMEFRPGVAPAPRIDPPVTPESPAVVTGLKSLSLSWSYTFNTYHPLDYFEVQFGTADAEWDAGYLRYEVPSSPSWGDWESAPGGEMVKTFNYLHPEANISKVYRYRIRFKDTFGNYSQYSTPTAPTAGTTEGIPRPVEVTDTSQAVQVALTDTSIRHCVLGCALNVEHLPAFIQAGTGLNIDIAASTSYPFVSALAFGAGSSGTIDYVAIFDSNVSNAWSGLPPSSQMFLYIDKATTIDGTVTLGYAETPCQVGKEFDKTRNVLCHFAGASGSTDITDEYGNEITVNGNARIGTAQSKFGGSALFMDGTNDYIDIAIPTLGGEPWVIEGWFRMSEYPTYPNRRTIFCGTNQHSFMVNIVRTEELVTICQLELSLSSNGTSYNITDAILGSTSIGIEIWYKLILVCTGTRYKLFCGQAGGAMTSEVNVLSSLVTYPCGAIRIGANYNADNDFNGYIDEFRYTAGSYRRYNAATTPEASAFTPDAYWFDLNRWKTLLGGPTTGWTEYIRLFIGEAITSASAVTTAIGYASGGTYDSGWFDVSNSQDHAKTTNLGTDAGLIQTTVQFRKNSNYNAASVTGITIDNLAVERGAIVGTTTRNAILLRTSANYVSPYGANRIGAADTAVANGQYRIVATRGF
jgi:hypothetical protein